jgi:hypothetical protein
VGGTDAQYIVLFTLSTRTIQNSEYAKNALGKSVYSRKGKKRKNFYLRAVPTAVLSTS